MMVYLLLVILNFFSSECFAQVKSYQFDPDDLLQFSSYESLKLSAQLSDLKTYPSVNFRRLGLPFDQLYHSPSLKKMLAVKFHLQPIGAEENELIELPAEGIIVTHIKVKGVWALVVAKGFEVSELKSYFAQKSYGWMNIIIPTAHAANCDPVQRVPGLGSFAEEIQSQSLATQMAQCLATGAQALTENLRSTLDFYTRLATEPLTVWREFKQGMEAFGQLIMNLREETAQLIERISGLDINLQAELICGMIGSLIATAGQALVLGPASFARALPSLTLKIRSMADKLSQLTRLTRNLPSRNLQGLSRELLQCTL